MVYILTIIVLVILIMAYDLNGQIGTNQYNKLYNLMMLWFIFVSAFAYNVGSDTIIYMYEYDTAHLNDISSLGALFNANERRGPAWIILETLCRRISSEFVFFKLIIAGFSNLVFFRFIRKHSQYPFVSVLFYGIILYLNLNFNAYRQFVAIAVFLIGYEYLTERKWLRYYLMVCIAYMFHSSAIVCALFPLFLILKVSRRSAFIIGTIILVLTGAAIVGDFNQLLLQGMLFYGGDMSSDLEYAASTYLEGRSSNLNLNGLIFVLILTSINFFVFLFSDITREYKNYDYKMLIVFVIFYALNFSVPVLFFRLLFYVQLFYICLLPQSVKNFATRILPAANSIVIALILAMFVVTPIKDLLRETEKTGYPLIVQYYPYYSIFNPQIDPIRSSLFGSHK